MLIKVKSAANYGLTTIGVDVEINISERGFPSFDIIGLPSKTVGESRDRVKTALINSGFDFPNKKITINLAPADLPKEGSFYDLPIAAGIMSSIINKKIPDSSLFFGELSLDGSLRHTKGSLLISIYAKESGMKNLFIPFENAKESAVVNSVNVFALNSLKGLYAFLCGKSDLAPSKVDLSFFYNEGEQNQSDDLSIILGQYKAKRALEISAAGSHNLFMVGSPGVGKSLLAKCMPSILPPLSYEESLEVTKIFSAVGRILPNHSLIRERQFRAPHHTISFSGLIGGGVCPKPGEISLAHRGILFLDEFSEFPRHVIESLRQPLEDGVVTIARSYGTVIFPCKFILVTACNPCPCGYKNHPNRMCICTQKDINNHNRRISGPILDRMDLFVNLLPVKTEELTTGQKTLVLQQESIKSRSKIIKARELQIDRYKEEKIFSNSELKNTHMSKYCYLSDACEIILRHAVAKFSLSARSYFKLIKIARTIADLDEKVNIDEEHIAEALQYRNNNELGNNY